MRSARKSICRAGLALMSIVLLTGQGRRFGGDYSPNIGYRGGFTYTRIRYTPGEGGYGRRYNDVKWDHDYPASDMHFPRIIGGVTSAQVNNTGSNIYTFNDPDLFK